MHMKRYTMPKFWPVARKKEKFVVTTSPGPHPKSRSIALRVVIRDVMGYAETAKEAEQIVKGGSVFVDKKRVKDDKRAIGLMDVVSFPEIKKHYRAFPSKKGLELKEIKEADSSKKLCMIKGKNVINGGKVQISLHDGRIIVLGKESKYKPGDSVLIELPSQKILQHFELKEGEKAVVIAGNNIGAEGKIKLIHDRKTMFEKSRVVVTTKDCEIETLKEYVLVGDMK
ncbi:MAG: 30S ribosomal protein S4e [Candidatus Aenigmarchaeota archaeon]|nr:30S ribosomal protein S4e [Candidatus Aenigmarchaeota archaeon]